MRKVKLIKIFKHINLIFNINLNNDQIKYILEHYFDFVSDQNNYEEFISIPRKSIFCRKCNKHKKVSSWNLNNSHL